MLAVYSVTIILYGVLQQTFSYRQKANFFGHPSIWTQPNLTSSRKLDSVPFLGVFHVYPMGPPNVMASWVTFTVDHPYSILSISLQGRLLSMTTTVPLEQQHISQWAFHCCSRD